jgi:pyruvate carboxylase subunit B
MKYIATVDGTDHEIEVDRVGEVTLDEVTMVTDLRAIDGSSYSLLLDNRSYQVFAERQAGRYVIMIDGDQFVVEVEDARLKQLRAMGGTAHEETGGASVVAPMPGLVVKVLVSPGDKVEANQGLLILEAMKMENELRSPRAGVVRQVNVVPGQTVAQGDLLVRVEEAEG